MKQELLDRLGELENRLRTLRRGVQANRSATINKLELRNEADAVADLWVESVRSPLEYRFRIPKDTIEACAQSFKRLHVISRPSNLKGSYLKVIDALLHNFKNRLVLPVQQFSEQSDQVLDLYNMVKGLPNPDESEYLKEAVDCAARGYKRASVVMGWCAAIDRMHRKVQLLGFEKFNKASSEMKNQTSGRFKRWNKEFKVITPSELQQVFDTDIIWVLEGLQLLDSNQGDRLRDICYLYRNQSAHPGRAPIDDAHLVAFFTDLNKIVLSNPAFAIS